MATILRKKRTVTIGDAVVCRSSRGIERQERTVGGVQNVWFHAPFARERPASGSLEADDAETGDDDDEAGQ